MERLTPARPVTEGGRHDVASLGRRLPATFVAPAAAMAAAQVAYPLAPGWRAGLATAVVGCAALAALAGAVAAWGFGRALAAAAATAGLALGVEAVGIRTGAPFGDYAYGPALRPTLAGVPVIVPLAWFALGAPAFAMAARITARPIPRIAAGALALTAWDLFLDPQMLREGFWRWRDAGVYRGVPLSNFGGWLLVAAALMAVYTATAGADRHPPSLLALYAFTALMETIGFLVFFRDPLVGVTGGSAMGAVVALALRRPGRRTEGG